MSDDRAGIVAEGGIDDNAKKVAVSSVELTKESEEVQDIFWTYNSDNATIDEEKLYDYLFEKGYRYFLVAGKNIKYLVIITNNKLDVMLLDKLWKLICKLIDRDFLSVAEEERTKVKDALYDIRKSLKKKRLIQFIPEYLGSFEETPSKLLLMKLIKGSNTEEGDAA
jgi:hypothetical protein